MKITNQIEEFSSISLCEIKKPLQKCNGFLSVSIESFFYENALLFTQQQKYWTGS